MNFVFATSRFRGLYNAAAACGHSVGTWSSQMVSAHDLFAKTRFDMLIVESSQMGRALHKCLWKYPQVKCILLAANKQEGLPGDVNATLFYPKPAADILTFRDGVSKPEFRCDVCFVGDYVSKAHAHIVDACHSRHGLDVKIFGNGWPVPQCLGTVSDEDLPDVYASAKVSAYDDEETRLNILVAGGNPSKHPLATLIRMEGQADAFTQDNLAQRRQVLLEATCFDTLADMFEAIGMDREVPKVLQAKGEALKGRL